MYLDIYTDKLHAGVYAGRYIKAIKLWHCLVTEEQLEALRKLGVKYKVVDEVYQGKTPDHVYNPAGIECERADKTRVSFSLASARVEEVDRNA